jgi:hypothetical protein
MRTCIALVLASALATAQLYRPAIPKVWDEVQLASMELPLAPPAPHPTHVSAAYYYSIPELKIFRSYPVDVSGKSHTEYRKWLDQQEPEIAFDVSKLKTEADWIAAGKIVFETSVRYEPAPPPPPIEPPPYGRYYVREKGKVEWGEAACTECHLRILPDGTFVNGAQSERRLRPFGPPVQRVADRMRRQSENPGGVPIILPPGQQAAAVQRTHSTPWFDPDPNAGPFIVYNTPGVAFRPGAAREFPLQISDLIGIKDRKSLDHTGLNQHRSIADLMRYAAMANLFGMERLRRYGDFIPYGVSFRELPEPSTLVRFSDEQLYAMALYIYSLKPPPNPNKPDAHTAAGEKIFRREGCAGCHTPALYTNNMLIPVDGFEPPQDHKKKYRIMDVRIGLDPFLALKTRRGTGYYKVPSLKGVWYRGPFEHHGSVLTLEDWFNPDRVRDDYVPTGYRGLTKTRGVKGHEFGLKLNADDKQALIAFLKTL